MTVKCFNCGKRSARNGSLFCSNRCACEWADELLRGDDHVWCPKTRQWEAADMYHDLCHGCGGLASEHFHSNDQLDS